MTYLVVYYEILCGFYGVETKILDVKVACSEFNKIFTNLFIIKCYDDYTVSF